MDTTETTKSVIEAIDSVKRITQNLKHLENLFSMLKQKGDELYLEQDISESDDETLGSGDSDDELAIQEDE